MPEYEPSQPHQIDQLCDQFKVAWNQGESPRIEEYLEQVEESDRKL